MDSLKITKNLFSYKAVSFQWCHHRSSDTHFPMSSDDKFNSALFRAKKIIREYSFNNNWDYFITLTISPKNYDRYKDKEKIVKRILKYFDNYRQNVDSSFRYLIVPELHEDGAVHFHGYVMMNKNEVLKFQYYDKKKFRAVYSHNYLLKNFGRAQFVHIKTHTVASANYITKYLIKDSKRIFNRFYYASKGLKRDEVIYSGFGLGPLAFDIAKNDLLLKINYNDFCSMFYMNDTQYNLFADNFVRLGNQFNYSIPSFVYVK